LNGSKSGDFEQQELLLHKRDPVSAAADRDDRRPKKNLKIWKCGDLRMWRRDPVSAAADRDDTPL